MADERYPIGGTGKIRVTPVLFCAPVLWIRDFWSESTHRWDWVRAETPLVHKPWVELEIGLDAPLGDVFAAACDAWQIDPGLGMVAQHTTREQQFCRFAFVRSQRDSDGIDAQEGYRWPRTLPIARACQFLCVCGCGGH